MKLTSTAFADHGPIPAKYTCEGQDIAPPLAWSDAPANTRSLALIVDDPDAPDPAAPRMTWVHWVLYDLPASAHALPEGGRPLPAGTREGLNDWHRTGYGGPCPPIGRHRYFFKLYALDALRPLARAGGACRLRRCAPHRCDSRDHHGRRRFAAGDRTGRELSARCGPRVRVPDRRHADGCGRRCPIASARQAAWTH